VAASARVVVSQTPSLLPLDYSRNLLIALVIIGAITGLLVVLRLLRKRPATETANTSESEGH